ncbi:MAG: MFS transporter [Dehalococcoidia bacterium]|nr:MFS transporter [Dehalococcoidia bacterium]MSQ34798.1 MFS transporter [Dehalococcoidia bacterium]
MMLPKILRPSASLDEAQLQSGLKWLTVQGTVAMGLDAITSGGFLAAYAIALGANNMQIGILAALPFLMQPLQLPAIILIERLGMRKAMSLVTFAAIQLLWVPIALIPFWLDVPSPGAMALLLGFIALRSLITAPLNAAWNGWLKDLVPQKIMGQYFARRLVFASVVGIGLSIGAGVFADIWQRSHAGPQGASLGYAIPILVGALTLGIMTPLALLGMPEPAMVAPPGGRRSLVKALASPMRDPNYRVLIRFRFLWALALNLAVPFFAVYMLNEIGLSVSMVMALTAVSQASNILFLPIWGKMVDRLGAKGILVVCCSLYVLVVLGWIFTTQPDKYLLTIPLLVLLHIMAGVATAGINVADGTLAFKLAPRGEGTAYLAAASLAVNFGAALGPLLGGQFADFFANRHFTINLNYSSADSSFGFSPLDLTGFDFLFGVAFILGVLTLSQLNKVKEEGETSKDMVMHELLASSHHTRPMSTVPGNSMLASFPLSHIRYPLPGLDVAVGVAAYEVSQAAHAATVAATRSARTTVLLVHGLENVLQKAAREGGHLSVQAVELAKAASHGAGRAGHQQRADIRHVADASTEAVLRSLARADEFSEELVHAVAFGFVHGVAEAGGHPGDATRAVIEAARKAAVKAGADQNGSVLSAARASVEAARAIQSEKCIEQVRTALWSDPVSRQWLLNSEGRTGGGPA